jgi:hypothetical protein
MEQLLTRSTVARQRASEAVASAMKAFKIRGGHAWDINKKV